MTIAVQWPMDIGVVDPWDEVHGPRISWQIRFVSSPINCWTANVAGANILTSGLVMLAPATFRFQRSLIASSLHQLQSSWDFTYECNLKLKTAAQTWHCELSTILVNFGYHNWLMNTFSFFLASFWSIYVCSWVHNLVQAIQHCRVQIASHL